MDRRALTRLRIAFLLLGAALLLPLALLLRSVDERLEAQRRLRHQLVAERIFDEMERELTSLLQRENARPSAAYADSGTRVQNWAPFVVGYFTRDAHSAQIIAKDQLPPERRERLEAALNIGKGLLRPAAASASESAPSEAQRHGLGADAIELDEAAPVPSTGTAAPASAAPQPAQRERAPQRGGSALRYEAGKSIAPAPAAARGPAVIQPLGTTSTKKAVPEDVLMQLNRASEAREQERKQPSKRKASSSAGAAEAPANDDPLSGY